MKRIKVSDPYQVVFGGTVFGPGDTADVPAELAAEWITAGWVTAQAARPPAKKATPTSK